MKYLLFCILLFICSCGTSFCIKVDGNYEGKSGGIQYCYSPSDSTLVNMPVFTGSDGKKIVGLSLDELKNMGSGDVTKDVNKKDKNIADFILEKLKK